MLIIVSTYMALADIIRSNTGLAQMSPEELAAQTGRAVAPIQPLETSVLGGTSDQSKMAGTPAQKASALRTVIQGNNDLATRQREQQNLTTANAQQKQEMANANKMQGLSSLEDRVQNLVNNSIATNATAKQPAGNNQVLQPLTGLDSATTALLNRIQANPNDLDAVNQINTKLGNTQPGQMLSATDIMNKYFQSTPNQVAGQLTQTLGDALKTGNLPLQQMGFSSSADLANAIGVDPKTIESMSIPDLVQNINAAIAKEYNQTSALETKANDPRLGAAERAEARQQLQDLGAVGVTSAESGMDKLADSIQKGETVKFMGQDVTVDQLLSNDYASGVIATYLQGVDPNTHLPNSDYSRNLAKTQPELAQFIQSHANVLSQAAQNVSQAVTNYSNLQQANKGIATAPNGSSLDDSIMQKIFPDWGTNRASQYDVNSSPLLQVLNDKNTPPEQANNLVQVAKDLNSTFPQFMSEFSKLSKDQLKQIGALGDTTAATNFQNKLTELSKITNIQTPDDVASVLGFNSAADLQNNLPKIQQMVNFGSLSPSAVQQIPGLATGDFNQMTNFLKLAAPKSLSDVIANMNTVATSLQDVQNAAQQSFSLPGNLADTFTNKTKIDSNDFYNNHGAATGQQIYQFLKQYPNKFTQGGADVANTYVRDSIKQAVTNDIFNDPNMSGLTLSDLTNPAKVDSLTGDQASTQLMLGRLKTAQQYAINELTNIDGGAPKSYIQDINDQLQSVIDNLSKKSQNNDITKANTPTKAPRAAADQSLKQVVTQGPGYTKVTDPMTGESRLINSNGRSTNYR